MTLHFPENAAPQGRQVDTGESLRIGSGDNKIFSGGLKP
jgi:hypothetical protein